MTKIFHKLNPETAHSLVIFLLKCLQTVFYKIPLKKQFALQILIKNYPQLKFRNKLGLAAGFDKNAEVFAALRLMGFGFIEVGTVTPQAQAGNSKPRIWRKEPQALINHLGFNNHGLEQYKNNLIKYKKVCSDFPIFCNIGKNKISTKPLADYVTCYQSLKSIADGFVINVSSPNTPGLRDLQSIEFLEALASQLMFDKPIFIKLSGDLANSELAKIADYIQSSSYAGLVLINTSSKLANDLYGFTSGGLSGEPLLNRSLECIQIAREKLKTPKIIIGVGGILNSFSAQRVMEAGADLIEIYTGFIYRGPKLVSEIIGK